MAGCSADMASCSTSADMASCSACVHDIPILALNLLFQAAVMKGILATPDYPAMDTMKRRLSLSNSRKNTDSVQVMKFTKLDT